MNKHNILIEMFALILAVGILANNVFAEDGTLAEEGDASAAAPAFNRLIQKSFSIECGQLNTNSMDLDNGDHYSSGDIVFSKKGEFKSSLPLTGSNVVVKWRDKKTKQWVSSNTFPPDAEKYFLIVDSSVEHYAISPIVLYSYDDEHHTRVGSSYGDVYFSNNRINISLPGNIGYHGDLWYVTSVSRLFPGDRELKALSVHDLDGDKRWCYDGYYNKAPTSYKPYRTGMFCRNPANYVGVSLARYATSGGMYDLGMAMVLTGINNQNQEGYWQTDCSVDWLNTDYGINAHFYDTRFNTDFAAGLIHIYRKYNDEKVLEALNKYADYFYGYAQEHCHKTANGILVEDYAPANKKVHCSLNHQLAELNFLYEYYYLTCDDKYLQLANKMLTGIDDTADYWVLKNHNLAYAYGYSHSSNIMIDYPYLTYNDLYETNYLLKEYFNTSNSSISYLMENKKIWMDRNGVTEYKK